MEQLNPNPLMNPSLRPPMPQLGQPGFGLSGGMRAQGGLINSNNLTNEQEEKKKEFARGIFVSGFEKCVTTAMIQHHFNIKPIYGLRHPTTKHKESKGFAFIYYGSEDDALYVKKTLDRTAILKEKVRITRTVISENLSKMMFKLKTAGLEEKQIQDNEAVYFNDAKLETEVERIIKPLFGTHVEVNKITIPHSKKDKKPLRYARVFFYVSDIKEASKIAGRATSAAAENVGAPFESTIKNEYEVILNYISELINKDETFARYAKSEIYEYTKKNQSNVLHIKGIKNNPKEDPSALADEVKEFIQRQNPQWNISNVYAAIYSNIGAWANVTFATYEETLQAYEAFKNSRPKFRDALIYASLRNVKDPRTVVISVVRKDANEKQVSSFLNELATKSTKNPITPGDEATRKYDFFSFNIIESKKFFKNDVNETEGVLEGDAEKIQPSWIEINEVPRRLIIHFFNEFNEEDIKELTNDIRTTPGYEDIFLIGDNKKQLRSNHQKGHVNKDGIYIKHTELKNKKKLRAQNRGDRPQQPRNNNRNNDPNRRGPTKPSVDFNQFSMKGVPKMGGYMSQFRGGNIPQIGVPSVPGIGIPNLGGLSGLGGLGSGSGSLPGTGLSGLAGLGSGSGSLPGTGLPGAPIGMGMPRPFNPIPGQQQIGSFGSQPMMGQTPMIGQPAMMVQPPHMNQNPIMGQPPSTAASLLAGFKTSNIPTSILGMGTIAPPQAANFLQNAPIPRSALAKPQ